MKITSKENYYLVAITTFRCDCNKQMTFEFTSYLKAKEKFLQAYDKYADLSEEEQTHIEGRLCLVNANKLVNDVLFYFGFGLEFGEFKRKILFNIKDE